MITLALIIIVGHAPISTAPKMVCGQWEPLSNDTVQTVRRCEIVRPMPFMGGAK
jgi:hypothetical protein